MPLARKRQISLVDTPYYHCISRCVRRAFLCGIDKATGISYEHRRQWVEDRLLFLSSVFAIDVCAYAVMSNHTHIVLHVDSKRVQNWSDKDVAHRWLQLHQGTLLTQQFVNKQTSSFVDAQWKTLKGTLDIYRKRLSDISWFMRELNEPIARKANAEDCCTGHFWEGRFKSQALLDESALLGCMVYVDLNPIRANMASTPEQSAHTSIKRRIAGLPRGKQPEVLMPFTGHPGTSERPGLTFDLLDYIELVDLTGRVIDPKKRGAVSLHKAPILTRLGVDEKSWQAMTQSFESRFRRVAGNPFSLSCYRQKRKRRRASG